MQNKYLSPKETEIVRNKAMEVFVDQTLQAAETEIVEAAAIVDEVREYQKQVQAYPLKPELQEEIRSLFARLQETTRSQIIGTFQFNISHPTQRETIEDEEEQLTEQTPKESQLQEINMLLEQLRTKPQLRHHAIYRLNHVLKNYHNLGLTPEEMNHYSDILKSLRKDEDLYSR